MDLDHNGSAPYGGTADAGMQCTTECTAEAESVQCAKRVAEMIDERSAVVGVIGLGYVGLPLAHTLHSAGFSVIDFDTDDVKIEKLHNGISYIQHISCDVATIHYMYKYRHNGRTLIALMPFDFTHQTCCYKHKRDVM